MSILNFFVAGLHIEAVQALLTGQEEYRLPRQILSNRTGTYQYVARLSTRDGKKGLLVEKEVNMYEQIKGDWQLANSTREFTAFYPLSVITQPRHGSLDFFSEESGGH